MTKDGVIRVGVIGLGIGRTHTDRYAKLPGAELVGVCDMNEDLAAQIGAEHSCAAFGSVEEMLAQVHLDAVSICTPPKGHPQLVEAAAARRIHVLVEKPMASTVEGCRQIIESCGRHGVVLMVGHKKRFAPPFVRLRELAAAGGPLGPIRQITLKYMHPGMSPKEWFWSEEDGGGPLLENHVHAADTLGFLAGAPQRVYAEGATRFVEGRAPLLNVAAYAARFDGLEGSGDVVVSVGYGMIGPVPARPLCEENWFFACERGVAEVTGPFDNLQHLRWARRGSRADGVHAESWPEADPFLYELAHFLDCVRDGTEPRASGEAGCQAVRFCLAVKESARSGAPVLW